jgi:predicted amidohydrolase
MSSLRIGLAQCRQTADLDTNAVNILRMMDEAARRRVQVLCFPETQTVGYRVDIATPDQPVPVEQLAELHGRVAARCAALGLACVLGTETPLESDPRRGKPYNSALVISETGQVLGVHRKTQLTPLDALAYTPGRGFETFELFGVRVGVVICFEGLRFADTTRECVSQGAQVIFHPQNNTTRPNDWKVPVHHAMIVTRAAENTVWFASCNACLEPTRTRARWSWRPTARSGPKPSSGGRSSWSPIWTWRARPGPCSSSSGAEWRTCCSPRQSTRRSFWRRAR